ncbi:uncharacterized protein [Paramisgurnus dabryanus]|uniref:uncharacterized protein n=1 Tax=Paramisgurnus dabryanus TaxID=90735 RepID=UPI0031F35CD4
MTSGKPLKLLRVTRVCRFDWLLIFTMASRRTGIMCAVRGCHNSWYKRHKLLQDVCFDHNPRTKAECGCGAPYDLHPPPKGEDSRRLWLKALNLKQPPKFPYVCSFHFVDRRPTEDHPFPEKWLGYDAPIKTPRLDRTRGRPDAERSHVNTAQPMSPPQHINNNAFNQCEVQTFADHSYASKKNVMGVHVSTQCHEEPPKSLNILKNDTTCLLYTGFTLSLYKEHVKYLQQFYTGNFEMHTTDQITMTMMKLKLNLLNGDLAERFQVSQDAVSQILSYWIDTMEEHTRAYVPWLPRGTIRATRPRRFMENFPNTTCIIDCSETVLQRARNQESYSDYCSINTFKYLVAVAPSGHIMFISPAFGSNCSDTLITQESGFLEYLQAGDEVMAGRGFMIRNLLFERGVNLVTPAYTNKDGQSSDEDVKGTRSIFSVIHQVIRRLKVFKIVSQTVPVGLSHKVDKILRVCAALVNMQGDIIPEDAE